MSARDWQPGEAEVEAAYKAWQKPRRVVDIPSPAEAFKEGYRAARADLLPVPQADEGAIERAALIADIDEWLSGITGYPNTVASILAEARALLASPVQPGRSEAETEWPDGMGDSHRAAALLASMPHWVAVHQNTLAKVETVLAMAGGVNPTVDDLLSELDEVRAERDRATGVVQDRAARVADTTDTEGGE